MVYYYKYYLLQINSITKKKLFNFYNEVVIVKIVVSVVKLYFFVQSLRLLTLTSTF